MIELHDKYDGVNRDVPKFTVAGFTHRGEAAPGLFELVERICYARKQLAIREQTITGIEGVRAAADFRTRFKDSLWTALALGWSRQMTAAGFSIGRGSRGSENLRWRTPLPPPSSY